MVDNIPDVQDLTDALNEQLGQGSEPIRLLKPKNPRGWKVIPPHMVMLGTEMVILANKWNCPIIVDILDEYMDIRLSVADKDYNARQQFERTHGSILERVKAQLAGQGIDKDIMER